MVSNEDKQLAKTLWDYHHVHHQLKKADLIFILCSHDIRIAQYGAQLFLDGWAPEIAISGGVAHQNDLLNTGWGKSEAETFADVATKMGIVREKIILETKAKNTGDNFKLTEILLKEKDLNPKVVICVQKPYMERRTLATGFKWWSDRELIITSPPLSFEEYVAGGISEDDIINIMVGDLQRIKIYGEKGFQVPQEIPEEVWNAYEQLMSRGFTKHIIA
jgi:uncharacterized SAM-binding protein YcdF (DUF218 family)